MKHPRLFGLSAVLLVLSAAAMMTALILMNNFAPLAEQPDLTAARILDTVAVVGVIVFTAASAVLWIGALIRINSLSHIPRIPKKSDNRGPMP
jgi:hypothetical protein